MQVNLGRLDRFVTEPQCGHGAVDAVLQQFHRHRVSEHMRCHAFLPQRRAGGPRHGQTLGHHLGQPVVAERAAAVVREDRPAGFGGQLVQPRPQRHEGVLAQRRAALLAALALAAQMASRVELHILAAQADQLRCPQPGLQGHD